MEPHKGSYVAKFAIVLLLRLQIHWVLFAGSLVPDGAPVRSWQTGSRRRFKSCEDSGLSVTEGKYCFHMIVPVNRVTWCNNKLQLRTIKTKVCLSHFINKDLILFMSFWNVEPRLQSSPIRNISPKMCFLIKMDHHMWLFGGIVKTRHHADLWFLWISSVSHKVWWVSSHFFWYDESYRFRRNP